MSTALVLAEPEPEARGTLARHLTDDGFDVIAAESAVPPTLTRPDLVLLGDARALDDWRPSCPVIVLGSPDADAVDRVRAFRRGCDDYVPRPFHYEELVERIRAVLRRATAGEAERIQVGDLRIDRGTRRVTVDGVAASLAAKEYELLLQLASDPRRVFAKDQLLRDIWGYGAGCRTRTLDSHASRLRRKLRAAGGIGFVVNVWGVGYKLVDE